MLANVVETLQRVLSTTAANQDALSPPTPREPSPSGFSSPDPGLLRGLELELDVVEKRVALYDFLIRELEPYETDLARRGMSESPRLAGMEAFLKSCVAGMKPHLNCLPKEGPVSLLSVLKSFGTLGWDPRTNKSVGTEPPEPTAVAAAVRRMATELDKTPASLALARVGRLERWQVEAAVKRRHLVSERTGAAIHATPDGSEVYIIIS